MHDNLKNNPEIDINILIGELQNNIDEFEKIDNDIEPSVKADILNRSLPGELRWINLFRFKNDYNKCSEYVKDVLPEIISSNLKEFINNNQNYINIFSVENNNINSYKINLLKILKKVDVITVINGVISFIIV